MKPVVVTRCVGKAAKVTLAADEVRIKIPEHLTPAQGDEVYAFFMKVVEKTPQNEHTLRGTLKYESLAERQAITLWQGTGQRAHSPVVVEV